MEPREFHWPFSAIYSCIASAIEPAYEDIARRIAVPRHFKTLLDIGGGDGRLAVALAKQYPNLSRIITADISKDMVHRAQKRAEENNLSDRIYPEVQDIHKLTYEDNHFDIVVSFFSMHHWREPTKAFLELHRVLKPNGVLAIFDGYDRPSFNDIRRTVATIGGSIWTSIVFWIGSKDVLPYNGITQIIRETKIGYISIFKEGPLLNIGGAKRSYTYFS